MIKTRYLYIQLIFPSAVLPPAIEIDYADLAFAVFYIKFQLTGSRA
jgi:hypothetical protein